MLLPFAGVLIGACAGLVFFGGLWWTTQRLVVSPRPGVLLLLSVLGRFGALAVCLIAVAQFDAGALVGALVGLVGARMVMTRAASQGRLPPITAAAGSSISSNKRA